MDPITIALLGSTAIKGIGGFFGSKSAEKKAKAAQAEALARYNAGIDQATGALNTGYDAARVPLEGYAASGSGANELLSNALGVNGSPAQSAFFASFQDDPGFTETLKAGQDSVAHSAVFSGGANSGATQKDLYSFGQRAKESAFRDRLDRLAGLSSQGQSAAGGISTIESNRGSGLADLALKRGSFGADNSIARGAVAARGASERANIFGDTVGDLVSTFARTRGGSQSASVWG